MRRIAVLCFGFAPTFLFPMILLAQDVVDPVGYQAIEDVVYAHKEGMALTLDVLVPEKNAKKIGVILVSSGSWVSGKSDVIEDEDRKRRTGHWVQGLLMGGYTLFIARHGSRPRFYVPEMIGDIRRSVRFIRRNSNKYGVDPDHLGITSGSSGGHLALMVALTGDDGDPRAKDPVERENSRIQAVVSWFPPTDLVNWGSQNAYKKVAASRPGLFPEIFGTITDLESQLKSISPIYHVTEDDPPLLLIHGDADEIVPLQQSRILKAKYQEVGLPVTLIVCPGGVHTTLPGIIDQYPKVWEWFDRYLSKN